MVHNQAWHRKGEPSATSDEIRICVAKGQYNGAPTIPFDTRMLVPEDQSGLDILKEGVPPHLPPDEENLA